MKKILFSLSVSIIPLLSFSQSYYYTNDGEKIEANISKFNPITVTIRVGENRDDTKALKVADVSGFVYSGDSIARLENTGISMGMVNSKLIFAQVVVDGPISYYRSRFETTHYEKLYYLIRKGNVYYNVMETSKKWKELFSDDPDIYDQLKEFNSVTIYNNEDQFVELIKLYNQNRE